MADKDKVKKRIPKYRNSIMRLIYMYGCFDKAELAKILGINSPSTLEIELPFLKTLWDGKYSVRKKRNTSPSKSESDEDYLPFNKLWELYDQPVETLNILHRAPQYSNFMYGILKTFSNLNNSGNPEESDGTDNVDEYYIDGISDYDVLLESVYQNYVLPFRDAELAKIRSKSQNAEKNSGDSSNETLKEDASSKNDEEWKKGKKVFNERVDELNHLGVLRQSDIRHGIVDGRLERLLENGEIDYYHLYNLICYSMHFLHPAIYGYRLSKFVVEIAKEDELDLAEPPIKYSGFQAQSILTNEKCIDIIDCIDNNSILSFDYLENDSSILEFESETSETDSSQGRKNILPYKLIYDMRYGRYYVIGLDYNLVKNKDYDNAMQRFRVDYMEKLAIKER